MKLDGFGIFVKDMPTMVRFYRDVLGFEIKEEENTTNVYLVKDGTLFLLYRRTDFEQMTESKFNYAHGTNGHFEIALSVDNYDAVDKAYKCRRSCGGLRHIIYFQSSAFIRRRLNSGSCGGQNIVQFTGGNTHCILRINKLDKLKKPVKSLTRFSGDEYNRRIAHK